MTEQMSEQGSGRDVHEVVTERYGEIARSGLISVERGRKGGPAGKSGAMSAKGVQEQWNESTSSTLP